MATHTKIGISTYLNQFHFELGDLLFPYITQLAEVGGIIVALLIAWFLSKRHLISLAIALIATSAVIQFLKRIVFSEVLRPVAYAKHIKNWHFVEGVELKEHFSFPSGHTAAAFCIFFWLLLTTENKLAKFGLLFLAYLTGFSRAYLSQHFLPDIVVGSVIGVVFAFVSFYFIVEKNTHSPK